MEICIRKQDNSADELTQKLRAENPSTSNPNPTSTDSEDLTDKTPQVLYSTCCRLLEFVVGLPRRRRHIHSRSVGVDLLLRM